MTFEKDIKKLPDAKSCWGMANEEQLVLSSHHSALSTLGSALTEIRDELDEHRECLNESSNEISSIYEYVRQIEAKLDKLAAKLNSTTQNSSTWPLAPLSQKEKEVFFVLYSMTESQPFATYAQLARRLCMSAQLVAQYITVIIEKGIPVLKKYDGGCVYLRLDDMFRAAQAKDNIVGVNTLLTYWA